MYSGDQYNASSTGLCQSLSVLATTTPNPVPPPVVVPGAGSISGVVYNDSNTNFKKEAGESGISGMTIRLRGGDYYWWGRKNKMKVLTTTTTDANGNYSFGSLADGVYMVEEIKLNDWVQMSADYKWVLVLNGKALTGLDFANANPSAYEAWKVGKKIEKSDDDDGKKENKKIEKVKKKAEQQAKKGENKQRQISKLLERIEKIKNR
jgi:hypothetical protein